MRAVGNCVNKAPISLVVLLVLEMHEDDDEEEENEDEDSPPASLTMLATPLV